MRRGIDPAAKAVLRRWFPNSVLERATLTFGEDTLFFADIFHRVFKASAVTFGDMISIYEDEFEDATVDGLVLLAHELTHVAQCEREGSLLIFLTKYYVHTVLGFLKYRRGYFGKAHWRIHPFERPAMERQIEVLKALGMKAVAGWYRRWLEKG